jgi:hypothetical protein
MKHLSVILKIKPLVLVVLGLFFTLQIRGQQLSETTLGVGINKSFIKNFGTYWDDECKSPGFLKVSATQSWYRTDKNVSLIKEAGLNMQYSHINLSGGELETNASYDCKILGLSAEASLQLRIPLDSTFALAIGPTAEYMLASYNDVDYSYFSTTSTPSSGSSHQSGFNRNYFKNPVYGIKLSLLQSKLTEKSTLKLNVSYLWTKKDISDFYTSSYFQVTLAVGFKSKKTQNDVTQ